MVKGKQTNKNQYKYFHPFSLDQLTVQYMYTRMRRCIAESQKRSAKGSNFKEDDRALPLLMLLLYVSKLF